MPKCVNVVILVIATNIVTLTIFANLKYEKLPSLSDAVSIIPGYSSTSGQNGASLKPSGWVQSRVDSYHLKITGSSASNSNEAL